MEDYIRVVIPYLNAELISVEALCQVQRLARSLPPSPTAFFECRLEDNQPQVDFSIGLFSSVSDHFIEYFLIQADWYSYRDIFLGLINSTSILKQYISYIFLEFDLPGKLVQLPMPCIFLAFEQEGLSKTQGLIELISKNFGYSNTASLESNLSYYFDCLPPSSTVTPIGLMLSRPNKPVRLGIQGTSSQHLLDYLAKLGWFDVTSTFSSITLALEKFVDSFRLCFDIYDSFSPKIGLECFLQQPSDESRWQQLLNYLVEIGVCTPVKRDALLTWPGFSQKTDAPELWPNNLAGGDLLLGSSALSIFWREISHIKIIYDVAEDCLSAKGYLSFGHSWLDVDLITEISDK